MASRQHAIDATFVSALKRDGTARAREATKDGAALVDARKRKVRNFLGVVGRNGKCRSSKIRNRISRAKSRDAPEVLRKSAETAWRRHWGTCSVVAQRGRLLHPSLDAKKLKTQTQGSHSCMRWSEMTDTPVLVVTCNERTCPELVGPRNRAGEVGCWWSEKTVIFLNFLCFAEFFDAEMR